MELSDRARIAAAQVLLVARKIRPNGRLDEIFTAPFDGELRATLLLEEGNYRLSLRSDIAGVRVRSKITTGRGDGDGDIEVNDRSQQVRFAVTVFDVGSSQQGGGR